LPGGGGLGGRFAITLSPLCNAAHIQLELIGFVLLSSLCRFNDAQAVHSGEHRYPSEFFSAANFQLAADFRLVRIFGTYVLPLRPTFGTSLPLASA
jgi:hypothetical protein